MENPRIRSEGKMPHQTSENSIECYRKIRKEGLIEKESYLILRLISDHQPATSRELVKLSGKERGNICRCLFDLVKEEKIKIAFSDKCGVTGKKVGYYTLIDWEKKKVE